MDWTGIVGAELKKNPFQGSLQFYAQLRNNARVPFNSTVSNLGDASVMALMAQYQWKVSSQLDLWGAETLSQSRLFLTSQPFPYLPSFIHLTGLSVHSNKDPTDWSMTSSFRILTSQLTGLATSSGKEEHLAGYFVVDMGIQKRIWNRLSLLGRIENILNRPVEAIKGYPLNRSFSMMLMGEL